MDGNRLIAKNSIILYLRLIITTFIGLYASRIVLLELGADNFGLYTIVGGIVSMLNVLNTTMIITSNRYITVEIGKGVQANINRIFNTLLITHLFFGIILLFFVEFIGVWYVNNFLQVDADKISDALFVLHLSALSAVVSTIVIPFQGLITAYEKFSVKATIEIFYSLFNLGIVLLLVLYTHNKLRIYAIYVFVVQFLVASCYVGYCLLKHRNEVSFKINKNRSEYLEISKFFGWQMISVFASLGTTQGGALIINSFFGTVLNAAFGIAGRVNEFVFSFVKNLNQASLPQIMKSYSSSNQARTLTLVYKLPKFTYFIMLIPAVPILLSIETILVLWLKEVPPYTAAFVFFRIIHGLISCLESGFEGMIDASGRIRKTKIFYSILFLFTLPVVYILYYLKFPPYSITLVLIFGEIVFLIFQTRILTGISDFKVYTYLSKTLFPVLMVSIFISPLWFMKNWFGQSAMDFILLSIISFVITVLVIFQAGLEKSERQLLLMFIRNVTIVRLFKKSQK